MSVSAIHRYLTRADINVSQRTVARDLDEMSLTHKLQSTESIPVRFYTSPDFEPDYQLSFNPEQLQMIFLALQTLRVQSSDFIKNLCLQTEIALLAKLPNGTIADAEDLKELTLVTPTVSGLGANIDHENFKLVMTALREARVIECLNHSPYQSHQQQQRKRIFSPLLLQVIGADSYLFVHDHHSQSNKKVKVSRLSQIRLLDEKVNPKHRGQLRNLEQLVGSYGGTDEQWSHYSILCTPAMAQHFREKKFHSQQEITAEGENFRISFYANHGAEIIRYLAGFGDNILEISPASVKQQIENIWRSGLKVA